MQHRCFRGEAQSGEGEHGRRQAAHATATLVYARAVLFSALLLAACGGTSTSVVAGGPYARPQAELFSATVESVRSQGYEVVEADASGGRVTVSAHTTSRLGTPSFVVQCYSPGWVQISMEGPGVRRQGDQLIVPGALFREYREFAAYVSSSLRRTGAE